MRPLAAGLLLVGILLASASAAAHVPRFGEEQRVISDTERSYAFFDALPPGGAHTWSFELEEGDLLVASVSVPVGSGWTPDVRLVGPDGEELALEARDGVMLEVFTPYAGRQVAGLDAQAPATGRYELTVTGEGGAYALGFGRAERFTPLEWALVPYESARIFLWEGRSAAWLVAPYVIGVAVAAGIGGRLVRSWAGIGAAGLFLGSALERLMRLALAAAARPDASGAEWAFALTLVLPSVALFAAALRARSRLAHAALAALGVVFWAGFFLGPLLSLVAALQAPPRATSPPPRAA